MAKIAVPNKRTKAALRNPTLAPIVILIVENGGKVTQRKPAKGGGVRLTFCQAKGSGARHVVTVDAGKPVRARNVRRPLKDASLKLVGK